MKTLYKITSEYNELLNELQENEGEITPQLEKDLVINEKELKIKSLAYLEVIKSNEAFISNIDAEIKRLQKMKKQKINTIDKLKNNLLFAVKTFGEFSINFTKFALRKSEAIKIINEDAISSEFLIVKQTIDKTAIKKAIKLGIEVQGAELIINKNLNIK